MLRHWQRRERKSAAQSPAIECAGPPVQIGRRQIDHECDSLEAVMVKEEPTHEICRLDQTVFRVR